MPKRVVILGAAGRDFHNFNTVYRDNPDYRVVAFTATQIPDIDDKIYPAVLAGKQYPQGIPIVDEVELSKLLEKESIDEAIFSYSDVSHEEVMHCASIVLAKGANFRLLGTKETMLCSKKPVVSVTAVRTGCGKSATSRRVALLLKEKGKQVVVIRHPMPYGDLTKQICQRFETLEDLKKHHCTIEEMEEYEPHIEKGVVVFAGVDYEKILQEAEKEADVIVWDGGNNDLPFIQPNVDIVLVDPHRPDHELHYHPGEANFRRANVLLISKYETAEPEKRKILEENIRKFNPQAEIVRASLKISVEDEAKIRGKRVLVVEDGPTLTHGGMAYGAGVIAAKEFQALEIVDPRPVLVGEMAKTFKEYPFIQGLLPAMGYGAQQIKDLEETINRVDCDTVLIATPIDLRRVCSIQHETCRVQYKLKELGHPDLKEILSRI